MVAVVEAFAVLGLADHVLFTLPFPIDPQLVGVAPRDGFMPVVAGFEAGEHCDLRDHVLLTLNSLEPGPCWLLWTAEMGPCLWPHDHVLLTLNSLQPPAGCCGQQRWVHAYGWDNCAP